MNEHEIYYTVRAHLLRQNEQARDEDGRCAYRGKNGTACAVGCLIKDEFYYPSMEGTNIISYHITGALTKSGIEMTDSTSRLLAALQGIHDGSRPNEWLHHLNILEEQWFKNDAQ